MDRSLLFDETGPVIPLDRRLSIFHQATEIKQLNPSVRRATWPASPCSQGMQGIQGDNRENSGFGEAFSVARRETNRQVFLNLDPA
jgi:hypothetical protein